MILENNFLCGFLFAAAFFFEGPGSRCLPLARRPDVKHRDEE